MFLKLTIEAHLIEYGIIRTVATYTQVNKQCLDDYVREQGEADEGRREQVNYLQITERDFLSTINRCCR